MDKRDIKDKIKEMEEILKAHYGAPSLKNRKRRRPLEEIILTILSQNTTDKNSYRAYKNMMNRFGTMEKLSRADAGEVADAIQAGGLGPTKARYILGFFSWLRENYGKLNCDFLCETDTDEAIEIFTAVNGIGVKTIAVALAFSCGRDIFPVDTHVFRVCSRAGVLPDVKNPVKAFYFLRDLIPEGSGFSMHMNVIKHGREVCTARNPNCEGCFLNHLCEYYQYKTNDDGQPG